MYSIELDCPPGFTRPDSLLSYAIEYTPLNTKDFTINGKSFGNWIFSLNTDKNEIYKNNIDQIKKNIVKLYENGSIRYGSWI